MKEIEITCKCRSLKLPDLGLTLVKGDVAHISEARAASSSDLRRAVQMSGVAARTVERFQTRTVQVHHVPVPALEASPPPPPVPVEPSANEIISRTNAFLSAELRRTQEALREGLKQDIREALKETVKELPAQQVVLTQSSTGAPNPTLTVEEPEERFIPSKVVPDLKVDVGTAKATKTKSGGVDAASKALRAVKGKKKASSASRKKTTRSTK